MPWAFVWMLLCVKALYNRHVAFSCANGGVWSEPVQPLAGRRKLTLGKEDTLSLQQQQMDGKRIPLYEAFDGKNRDLLDNWASWNDYRLSQLSADAFSIRKRANDNNPWIGTFSGTRSGGYALSVILREVWDSACMIFGSHILHPSKYRVPKLHLQRSQHGYGAPKENRWTYVTTIMSLMI